MKDMLQINSQLKAIYPGFSIGILVLIKVNNNLNSPQLILQKEQLEKKLRQQFADLSKKELAEYPTIKPYTQYYKNFGKTYHVKLQLESIVAGKSIPAISPLVTSMFMAEIKNQILTAGHDLDQCQLPLELAMGDGQKTYTTMNGNQATIKDKDLFISDQNKIISSIIYGPDQQTKITKNTTSALYVTYNPAGVEKERALGHLQDIADYVMVSNPEVKIEVREVKEV